MVHGQTQYQQLVGSEVMRMTFVSKGSTTKRWKVLPAFALMKEAKRLLLKKSERLSL